MKGLVGAADLKEWEEEGIEGGDDHEELPMNKLRWLMVQTSK